MRRVQGAVQGSGHSMGRCGGCGWPQLQKCNAKACGSCRYLLQQPSGCCQSKRNKQRPETMRCAAAEGREACRRGPPHPAADGVLAGNVRARGHGTCRGWATAEQPGLCKGDAGRS